MSKWEMYVFIRKNIILTKLLFESMFKLILNGNAVK